jgi:uncharacterized SAM-binding protein YcdF (DUF218 family)
MFVLKQFLKDLILPPGIWLALMLAVLLFWRRAWARKLLLATFLLVLVMHSAPIAQLLGWSLESRYPWLPDCRKAGGYQAIVVLTSSAEAVHGLVPYPTMDAAGFRRADEALRLYRCDPKPVIVCGGHVDPFTPAAGENQIICSFLTRWGIPVDRVIPESKSRDTFEGAIEVGKILRQRNWNRYLLVTSAAHMPRSMLAFRASAPEPIAAPADFRASGTAISPFWFFPTEEAAGRNYVAVHEYLGLLNYRWRAWLSR